jgi:pimeloyl-ACP methyl ester carboxylesterase
MASPITQPRHHNGNPNPARFPVVIPVTGIANAELGGFSTGSLHLKEMNRALVSAGLPVTRTLTPKGFGIIGSMDSIYAKFSRDVDAVLNQFGPCARPLFLGYSLGGVLALRDHALRGSAGTITLGAPHGPMRRLPLPHERIRVLEPYSRVCHKIGGFSLMTLDMLADRTNNQNVVFAGATTDEVVGLRASVPNVPGVRRVLFGPALNLSDDLIGIHRVPALVEHGTLPTQESVTRFVVQNALEMSDLLMREPAQDDVSFVDFGAA